MILACGKVRGDFMNSILTSIKKMLGIPEEDSAFDNDIVMHINTVFGILTQMGVGSQDGFSITGHDETWDSFTENQTKLEMVKSYIYLKVRLLFDPPQNSSLIESINRLISELEWRLNVAVDP